jgi:transcription termination/antitermination protein NusG
MAWYTLQTNPNYEAKVIEGLNQRIEEKGLTAITEIFSPEESITEIKDGKKKERMRRLYTNYIFINMEYSDEIWHHLKGIRGVVGFVGATNRSHPSRVPDSQIAEMKARVSGSAPKPKVIFAQNDNVRIKTGAFADFNAIVKTVDYDKNKASLEVTVFGRPTPVEIALDSIEHVKE